MKTLLRAAFALLLLIAAPAWAADPYLGIPYRPVGGQPTVVVQYCPSASGLTTYCATGGGGGGSGGSVTVAVASSSIYIATAGGTGYVAGDVIQRMVTSDPTSGTVSGAYWIDVTSGTQLAATPSAGNLTPLLGTQTTLDQVRALLAGTLQVSVGNFPATQAISAASLPLPSNAATASGLAQINTTLGTPLQAGGAVTISGTPTFNLGTAPTINVVETAALPAGANTIGAVNIASGGLGSSGSPLYTTGSIAVSGATGSAVPANATQLGGRDGSGNLRAVATGTNGGLLPGQATPTSTRTTLTANGITTIDAARTGRLLATVQMDGSPAAAVYLCFNGQSATCSATVYDVKVASGAADASLYTAPFGMTGAVYAFSTGTPVVNVSSWLVQ